MSFLKSSSNYIWNINDVLGKGATGAVFKGTNKKTGELVAVKSFNHLSHMRPYEVQKREFEVLKKVNHPNIVKLLSIEEESETQQKVLIMELCSGGSLFNILDKPVNCYGLDETEFMTVLKHLAAGMKHLRDMNIIHRDLKPDNIMKYIAEDGYSIYKLTDFGAARELQEDQQFMSLYGTEEYLHPTLFEKAVLRKPSVKSFKANVDLWSIGVTLYHIATGSLPFRPYGGRKNKETMFKITIEKQSGIVSGVQHTENGEIEWSKMLPKACLLSLSLQQLITPLLAGLMECDSNKMWSFEKFFKTVTTILSHRLIHVFDVNKLKNNLIYLHPNETINELKHRIEIITSCSTKKCLLLFNNKQVFDLKSILVSTESNPVILINTDLIKIKQSSLLLFKLPKFPDFPSATNCDKDAQVAKLCSALCYSLQRVIKQAVGLYKIIVDIPSTITSYVVGNVRILSEKKSACCHLFNSIEYQIKYIENLNNLIGELNHIVNESDEKQIFNTDSSYQCQQLFSKLNEFWNGLVPRMDYMNSKVKMLRENWPQLRGTNGQQSSQQSMKSFGSSKTLNYDSCNLSHLNSNSNGGKESIYYAEAKGDYYCAKVRDSWQSLHRDKCNRTLNNAEEQLHHLEKIKIENHTSSLIDVLKDACFNGLREITEKLEDWYKIAQVSIIQSDCLFEEFSQFWNDAQSLQKQLFKVKEEQKSILDLLIKKLMMMRINQKDSNECLKEYFGANLVDNLVEKSNQYLQNEVYDKLPKTIVNKLDHLNETQIKLWSLLHEQKNLITEFESFDLKNSN